MYYTFDFAAWYSGTSEEWVPNSTTVAPTNFSTSETNGLLRSNWYGTEWVEVEYLYRENPYIAQRKAEIWDQIKAYRTERLAGGYLYDGHWYHSDLAAKIELLGLQNKAIIQRLDEGDLDDFIVIDGTNTQIKTIDNGYMELTFNDALNIALAGEVQTKRTYERAAIHKALLDATSDPDSYNWYTGWPAIYGE